MINASIFSLLPGILVIIIAYKKRNIYLGLIIGIITSLIISIFVNIFNGNYNIYNILLNIPKVLIKQILDPFNIGVIIQVFIIGGFVALLLKVDSFKVLVNKLSVYAHNQKNVSIITWLMGMFIFFDGIANMLIVGPLIKPLAKKVNLSKEKLAFIIDATSAPIAGLAIVSTWVGYEIVLLNKALIENGITGNPLFIIIESLPYRFYNILMIIFVIAIIIMKLDFGKMSDYQTDEIEITPEIIEDDGKIRYAVIPITILIISLFGFMFLDGYISIINSGGNVKLNISGVIGMFGEANSIRVLLVSSSLGLLSIILILKVKYQFKMKRQAKIILDGNKNLGQIVLILLLAWSFSALIKDIGIQEYLSSLIQNLNNISL